MATNPKMKPCPKCGSGDHLSVYTYEVGGARHVECDNGDCWYLGPGEGSIRQAIKSHNELCAARDTPAPQAEPEASPAKPVPTGNAAEGGRDGTT